MSEVSDGRRIWLAATTFLDELFYDDFLKFLNDYFLKVLMFSSMKTYSREIVFFCVDSVFFKDNFFFLNDLFYDNCFPISRHLL